MLAHEDTSRAVALDGDGVHLKLAGQHVGDHLHLPTADLHGQQMPVPIGAGHRPQVALVDLVDVDRSQAVLGDHDQTDPGHGVFEAGGLRPGANLLKTFGHGFQVDVVVAGLSAAAGDGSAAGGGQGAVGPARGARQAQGSRQDVLHRGTPQEDRVLGVAEGRVDPGGSSGGDRFRSAVVQIPEPDGQSSASRGGRPPGGAQW